MREHGGSDAVARRQGAADRSRRIAVRRVAAAAAALLVAGCSSVPRPPDTIPPRPWRCPRSGSIGRPPAHPTALAAWWERFRSAIAALVARASINGDVAHRAGPLRQARAQRDSLRQRAAPAVDGQRRPAQRAPTTRSTPDRRRSTRAGEPDVRRDRRWRVLLRTPMRAAPRCRRSRRSGCRRRRSRCVVHRARRARTPAGHRPGQPREPGGDAVRSPNGARRRAGHPRQ